MNELSVRQYLHNDGSGLTWGYDKREADKVIEELEKKLDIYKRGWMENDRVNANQYAEIRKAKRALWLARAERAVAEQTVDEWSRYKEKHPFGSWRADPFEYWMQAWICVEKICRKKAEDYK